MSGADMSRVCRDEKSLFDGSGRQLRCAAPSVGGRLSLERPTYYTNPELQLMGENTLRKKQTMTECPEGR